MNTHQIERILDKLSGKFGICLPPDEQWDLRDRNDLEGESLADEICSREGLDPLMMDKRLYRDILDVIRTENKA